MMNFSPLLKRFAEKAPLPVMMRALLQRELDATQLDRWFETVAQQQYTRKLLFSTLFELMTQVVLRQSGSIRAAWLEAEADVGVSLASVYNKLNGLEPSTSAALVSFAAQRSREVIDALPGAAVEVLAGLPVRVLDGNCLNGRQHRLKVTRASTAAPLPVAAQSWEPVEKTEYYKIRGETAMTLYQSIGMQVLSYGLHMQRLVMPKPNTTSVDATAEGTALT